MATPLASRATKQTARKGAPDSVSRSVVREGAQAAAGITVKRGAHAAAPAPQASLTVSRQPSLWVAAKCGVCVVLAEAWSSVRATTKASAGPRNRHPASHVPLRCTASQVQRCAGPPRLRSPGYDLRRAPCIHPHFASNAIRGGLNQRFHKQMVAGEKRAAFRTRSGPTCRFTARSNHNNKTSRAASPRPW
jgi:hypothetical protein